MLRGAARDRGLRTIVAPTLAPVAETTRRLPIMPSKAAFPYAIRVLAPADAEAYRELRLEALAGSPEAFGSSYEEEAGLSPDDFRARIPETGPNRIFAGFMGRRLMGMAG